MPPRIPGFQRLGALNLCLRPSPKPCSPCLLPLTQTTSLSTKEKKRMAKQDPYRWAQMQQRTAAHGVIKERVAAERQEAFGDPVHGITTPFVESFDSAGQAPLSTPVVDNDGQLIKEPFELPTSLHIRNNLVLHAELEEAIQNAYTLTQPVRTDVSDPLRDAAKFEAHEKQHAIAVEALDRITHMDNASAKDRRHANTRRIIETLGRHETDKFLPPQPLARSVVKEEEPGRAGPDTGSSEVQIGILTAKIRALALELRKGRGFKDKVGKRSLRLMVHKRQKLIQYLVTREREGLRSQNMAKVLGLTNATWKGQITM